MPASDQLSRKYEQIEHLYAICKHGYSKPKVHFTQQLHFTYIEINYRFNKNDDTFKTHT